MPQKLKREILINYICQFCEKESPSVFWKNNKCPKCKKGYDWKLAQDSEE